MRTQRLILAAWAGTMCLCTIATAQDRQAAGGGLNARARTVLGMAGEMALGQEDSGHLQRAGAMHRLAAVSMRAGDLEGAAILARKIDNECNRRAQLLRVAEAFARAGLRERAESLFREGAKDYQGDKGLVHDGIVLAYLGHQLAAPDLAAARRLLTQLVCPASRVAGWRRLGAAQARAGQVAAARESFALSAAQARGLSDDYDRARGLWELAGAQASAGMNPDAKATLADLLKVSRDFQEAYCHAAALREAGSQTAKMGDAAAARTLFADALAASQKVGPPTPCPESNKVNAMVQIAQSQAEAGFYSDALETARRIPADPASPFREWDRRQAVRAVAMTRAKAGLIPDALATAVSIQDDAALSAIVACQIGRDDLDAAAATAKQIGNGSERAASLLHVASAHARAGRKAQAREIAGRIRLVQEGFPAFRTFDFDIPATWAGHYDQPFHFSSMSTIARATAAAQQVSLAAMGLHLALGGPPEVPFDRAFRNVDSPDIVRSLARAHAATGDSENALAWARRIGTDRPPASAAAPDFRTS